MTGIATDTAHDHALDAEELRAAVAAGNLPTLLMVLVHLTGDERWLRDPYRPSRSRGMSDNDDGGFPEAVQDEIRAAAVEAIAAHQAGTRPIAISTPTDEQLVAMMSAAVGEPVAAEYVDMVAAELGFAPDREPGRDARDQRLAAAAHLSVVVVGAGFSGLCIARRLEQAGIAYTLVEKNPSVGGTWFENRYPGCGVDSPSHLYSYSFATSPDWTSYYAKRQEIHAYLERCADAFGVRGNLRLGTTVDAADYDAATQRWRVAITEPDGTAAVLEANVVVSAVGQLNRPKVPHIPGLESFDGPAFHSARWPEGLSLEGQRVAVLGTGASAMQIVPAIVDEAGSLEVFQRSPQWAAPNENYRRSVAPGVHELLDRVPFYARWYRFRLLWTFNDRVFPALQVDPDWPHPERSINQLNDAHRASLTRYITNELGDDAERLLPQVLPGYPPFGKRMLVDNGWFAAMRRPDVALVTEHVTAVTPDGVTTADGEHHPADVLVLATGFDSLRLLAPMEVHGRDGADLRAIWGEDDASAMNGIVVPGFPNLFLLYGPNTNLGHGGSVVFHAECQVRYVMSVLEQMLDGDLGAVECRQDAHDDYVARVDAAHAKMIWTHPGMDTWYRNARGRVVTNSPWRLVEYWEMTRRADLAAFTIEPRTDAATKDTIS
jgi:4-hydroxyacetophenone monooxygenase